MQQIVGIAEMLISKEAGDEIVTYALGSCLGIAAYDPVAKVGGLLHVMLPLSSIDPDKASQRPYMFVDTGLPRLFLESYKQGAQKNRMIIKVAGGANLQNTLNDTFQIGKRNFIILRKMLWKNGVLLKAQDVGGSCSRTMTLNIASGEVSVRTNGVSKRL